MGYKALSLTLPSHERQFARELLYGCYPYPNEFDRACAPAGGTKPWKTSMHAMAVWHPSGYVNACVTRGCGCRWANGAKMSRHIC